MTGNRKAVLAIHFIIIQSAIVCFCPRADALLGGTFPNAVLKFICGIKMNADRL